jgi:hypothetical protein
MDFITLYFAEEKIESLIFVFIGVLCILLALFFLYVIKYSLYKGISIPFLGIGFLQLMVGIIVFLKNEQQLAAIKHIVRVKSAELYFAELQRVTNILNNFFIYKMVEIGLIGLGILLILVFFKSSQTFWKGIGLGLLMQASITFTLDHVAQKRNLTYHQALIGLNIKL